MLQNQNKQLRSRKKELDKIVLEDIKPSSRVYPFIEFKFERQIGNDVLEVENVSKKGLFKGVSFNLRKGDKVAIIGPNTLAITSFFDCLMGKDSFDEGRFKFGITINPSYMESNNDEYFKSDMNLVDWLRPYSKDQHEAYLRGFLGRMLFSNEEALKPCNVLSGGERVRCMLAKTMMNASNLMIFDDPTNHLDLESISALNKGMINYKGVLLFSSHDHELLNSVANRIIYIDENEFYDKLCTYDEFIEWKQNR